VQDLNDLYYFAKVVENGGFAAAARALGVPKSRLSRRIATLESVLNVRLLQRTTRRLSLTETGKLYYQHARNVMAEAEAAVEAVERVREVPSGVLRVSCPTAIAQIYIRRILPKFLLAHPQVLLQLLGINRRVDLVEEAVDVALRVRLPGDEEPNLVTRRFVTAPALVVMHPELLELHGPLDDLSDLARVPAIGFNSPDGKVRWKLTGEDGRTQDVALSPRLMTDDFNVMRTAALAGIGITMLPSELCVEDIAAGHLSHVLRKWSAPASLQAVYVSRRGMVPAVRAFLDFLEEELGAPASAGAKGVLSTEY
jgi:DNA-binding transcriptional LysR family regulator